MPRQVDVVPHTHWDREWYRPFQSFRMQAGRPARRAARPHGGRSGLRPLHARRADGRGRRLPRRAARERRSVAAPGRRRTPRHGPLVHPDGRVPGLGRDHGPRPAAGPGPGGRLRRGHGGRLPARHVRPHRPDAPDPGPVRVRPRRGVAGRAVGRRCRGVPLGGTRRHVGPRRLPADRVRQRRGAARRRQGADRPGRAVRRRAGAAGRGPRPVDERHRPPPAPGLPRPRGGRGQRHAATTCDFTITSLAEHVHAGRTDGLPRWRGELRSGARSQPAHGGDVQPGRRPPGRGPGRAGPGAQRRAAVGAVPRRRAVACQPCSTRRGCR